MATIWTLGNVAYALFGAVLGTIMTLLSTDAYNRIQQKRRLAKKRKQAKEDIREAQLVVDHSDFAVEIQTWSPSIEFDVSDQILSPNDVGETRTTARPRSSWLTNPEAWQREFENALVVHGVGAPTAYLVGLTLDNPETRSIESARRRFQWTVARGNYAEFLATLRYLTGPGKSDQGVLKDSLRNGWEKTFAMSPPTIIACNVSLVSADNMVLILERSQATATSRGLWSVGPHETMNWRDPAALRPGDEGGPESAFTLGHRTIREELGLFQHQYGPILYSWFGIWLRDASAYLIGHVRSRLLAAEISAQLSKAQSSYEISMAGDAHAWIPYEFDKFKEIIVAAEASQADTDGRRWLEISALSLRGLWIMRSILQGDASTYFERESSGS